MPLGMLGNPTLVFAYARHFECTRMCFFGGWERLQNDILCFFLLLFPLCAHGSELACIPNSLSPYVDIAAWTLDMTSFKLRVLPYYIWGSRDLERRAEWPPSWTGSPATVPPLHVLYFYRDHGVEHNSKTHSSLNLSAIFMRFICWKHLKWLQYKNNLCALEIFLHSRTFLLKEIAEK